MEGLSPSQITEPRVLALRVTTTTIAASSTAAAYLVEALTHEVEELKYSVCVSPWVPTETGVECTSLDFPLPPGPTALSTFIDIAAYPIPDEYLQTIKELYVRADDENETITPTIFKLDLQSAPENPAIKAIKIANESPEDWIPSIGDHEVTLEYEEGFDSSGIISSFYTTTGSFGPWRSFDGDPSTLTLDAVDGPINLYVISRVQGKGSSWIQAEINQ
jgi:hypothetical protein